MKAPFFAARLIPLALLISLVLPLGACDTAMTFLAGESASHPLALSNWSGTNATVSTASTTTARTQAEWEALWRTTGQTAPGILPEGKMAVAVFLGQRFDASARVEIITTEIVRRVGQPERAIVSYRELGTPGIDSNSKAVISPWVIRLMDKTIVTPDFQRANS